MDLIKRKRDMKIFSKNRNTSKTTLYAAPRLVVVWIKYIPLLMVGLMSGCSSLGVGNSDYACPGMPNGVQCMSTRDVYEATENGKIPRPIKAGVNPDSGDSDDASSKHRDSVVDNYVTPRIPDQPIPVRTPAQVMRIWVAPWEDENGDLMTTGYVYTEIEPRKWVIAEQAPESAPTLKPLEVPKVKKPINATKVQTVK